MSETTETPKGVLLGRIHNISKFASTDDCRYVLRSIHYNEKEKLVEATDGRILIRVPVPDIVSEFPTVKDLNPAKDVIIPIAPFRKALSNAPKNGNLPILRHMRMGVGEDGKVTLTTNDLDNEQAISVKGIEGTYPDTEQVIPTEEPKLSICLSANLLEPLVDYAKNHAAGEQGAITFSFIDALSPVTFKVHVKDEMGNLVDATGVLMPMRTS